MPPPPQVTSGPTAATGQLRTLLSWYTSFLPLWTFPYVPLGIAAIFQSMAWLSGPIFLSNFTLIPRVLILWLFAAGEYGFMSPSMNAAAEVLGYPEPQLVVIYQVMTLIIFALVDIFLFKKEFKSKYFLAFALLAAAVYVTYL